MSSYYDDRRDDRRSDRDRGDRGDRDRKRPSRRHSPQYEEEEIIEARRRPKGSGGGDRRNDTRGDMRDDRAGGQLIRRSRDEESDFEEEIPRGHIPDGRRRGNDYPPRSSKPTRDRKRGGKYDNDYDSYDDELPRRRRDDRRRE